jgi:hypothetical protein
VYCLDGKKAAIISIPDDISILAYEIARGRYYYLPGQSCFSTFMTFDTSIQKWRELVIGPRRAYINLSARAVWYDTDNHFSSPVDVMTAFSITESDVDCRGLETISSIGDGRCRGVHVYVVIDGQLLVIHTAHIIKTIHSPMSSSGAQIKPIIIRIYSQDYIRLVTIT